MKDSAADFLLEMKNEMDHIAFVLSSSSRFVRTKLQRLYPYEFLL